MTAVSWDEDGWDDEPPTPAVPDYFCGERCCWTPPRPPGLLKRLLHALRRHPPEGTTR